MHVMTYITFMVDHAGPVARRITNKLCRLLRLIGQALRHKELLDHLPSCDVGSGRLGISHVLADELGDILDNHVIGHGDREES